MNWIGPHIEKRRLGLGLSRAELAERAGVSAQTILNVERRPDYNLNTRLLERFEEALGVSFELSMKESAMSSTTIQMGNDTFIFYIRQQHPECSLPNGQLGKRIWGWIREQDSDAVQGFEGVPQPCLWGEGAHTDAHHLPVTATQFEFKRALLPNLYTFLDQLGAQ